MVQSKPDFEITRDKNSIKLRKFDKEIELNIEDMEELDNFISENPDFFYIKGDE